MIAHCSYTDKKSPPRHDHFLFKCVSEVLLLFPTTANEQPPAPTTAPASIQYLFHTVAKLLSTCVLFATSVEDFLSRFSDVGGVDLTARNPLTNQHFLNMVAKFERIFENQTLLLLTQAKGLVATSRDHFVANLVLRVDYNGWWAGRRL